MLFATVGAIRPIVMAAESSLVVITDVDAADYHWLVDRLELCRNALGGELAQLTGVSVDTHPLSLLLFRNHERYQEHVRVNAPRLAHNGGFYDGATRTIVTHLGGNPLQLYFHELAHAVIGDLFGDPGFYRYGRKGWPVWFDEGLAEHLSSFVIDGGVMRFAVPNPARLALAADAMERGKMPPLERVLELTASDFHGPSSGLYYAAAWSLTHWLSSDAVQSPRVATFVNHLLDGMTGRRAFNVAFGDDLGELEKAWHRHVLERVRSRAQILDLLPRESLDPWVSHPGAHWSVNGGVVQGEARSKWGYLTRAVSPTRVATLRVRLKRGAGAAGLVLGHHAVDSYLYHTLVELEADRLTIRRTSAANEVKIVKRVPFKVHARKWTECELFFAAGRLQVVLNGETVVSTRVHSDAVSLVGMTARHGTVQCGGFELETHRWEGDGATTLNP